MNKCEICRCNKICDHNLFGFEICDNFISEDVVEVVRCSECAYCAENICPITGQKMYFCAYHPNNYPVTLTHYCGYGERKVE